jgi:hypothetical protein
MIPNQAAPSIPNQGFEPSWTKNFLGETKCNGGACFSIQVDGRISATSQDRTLMPQRVYGRTGIGMGPTSNCRLATYAEPVFTQAQLVNGLFPYSWVVRCVSERFPDSLYGE